MRSIRLGLLFLSTALLLTILCSPLTAYGLQTRDYTRWVNPFIGTDGHGHTFPGATTPFGMVQLSPDTRIDNWDGSSGYHYSDDVIYGFSHTHLSGTGIPDYCDILVMPTIDGPPVSSFKNKKPVDGYRSKFSHDNEKAEPGYYAVKLDDTNIYAEMTATPRVGFHRYTFPESEQAAVYLDLRWRDEVLDSQLILRSRIQREFNDKVRIVGPKRFEGYRRSRSWAKDQTVYFAGEFSNEIESVEQSTDKGSPISFDQGTAYTGKGILAKFNFKTNPGEQVMLKVALSPVSIAGARKNLEAELDHWDFDKVRREAKVAWNKELSKIEVSGGSDAEMTNFYTSLYHSMIAPNIYQDVDGSYRGMDGRVRTLRSEPFKVQSSKFKVRKAKNEPSEINPNKQTLNFELETLNRKSRRDSHYTVFSLWDTFRATHPLYTIIDEQRTVEFINTFIRIYEQGGKLPVWELAGNETDTMIGYNAVSVIADAMAKGIEGFDYEKAYKASKHSAELDIEGLDSFRRRGYISMEDEQESVSRTLEYAYNSYCLFRIAELTVSRKIGKLARKQKTPMINSGRLLLNDPIYKEAKVHLYRAQYYKNLFDKSTGFMRPKQNGNWISPFAPNEVTFHFTEANSWQYTFFVPHDVNGLIALYGGIEQFAKKLDGLFEADPSLIGRDQPDITGLIGQYAHGNEPSHHIAYLYNYAGQPWKTQKYVRKIMDEFYKPTPDGLIGNEDCGQMSAWYVLSALGFYPVNPGDPVYSIGTPIFKEARINLESGRSFRIKKKGDGIYVKSLTLNGLPKKKPEITHRDITNGNELVFEMSDKPVKEWFTISQTSRRHDQQMPAVPVISGQRVFEKETFVSISNPDGFDIYYTTDGTDPDFGGTKFEKPFRIDRTTTVKAVAYASRSRLSLTAESILHKMPNNWDVKLHAEYSRQYTGGGPKGLIDGLRGTTNFASGEWQGYWGRDFEAVIDLKKPTEINQMGGSFLQVARSWIWMPTKLEFESSLDGKTFTKVAEIDIDFPEREMTHTIKEYRKEFDAINARYVRVKATNFGTIPDWHPGAGFQAYIFVDEIFIK